MFRLNLMEKAYCLNKVATEYFEDFLLDAIFERVCDDFDFLRCIYCQNARQLLFFLLDFGHFVSHLEQTDA